MSRILSILLMGFGGYFLFKRRFRVLNVILGNPMARRFAVRAFMSIPGVKNKVIGSVFPQGPKPI
ncbi:hypothetical protein R4Z10_15795 [Niallia sp. XMNu-256]|uniref:hypothetical protein n=1 Tax=Niallia sp. XMNu-256 TaxID=3082444 RepID=UPI0030CC5A99